MDYSIEELIIGCSSWQVAQHVSEIILDHNLAMTVEFFNTQNKKNIRDDRDSSVTLLVQTQHHLISAIEDALTSLNVLITRYAKTSEGAVESK